MSSISDGRTQHRGRLGLTRDLLRSGSHLEGLRRCSTIGPHVLSDDELDRSLHQALSGLTPGSDCWLFGYGSLMWNPAFRYVERRMAVLHGFERQFCLEMPYGRGTPERPGFTLALEEGDACHGVAFRIAADDVRDELRLVWSREMATGSYLPEWVAIDTTSGPVQALTFLANKTHERYVSGVPEGAIAASLAIATGQLGSCAIYLEQTVEALRNMQVEDQALERLWSLVRHHQIGSA